MDKQSLQSKNVIKLRGIDGLYIWTNGTCCYDISRGTSSVILFKSTVTSDLTSTISSKFDIMEVYEDYTLNRLLYKRPQPILDDIEKRYLAGVIRPFRDRVAHITLFKDGDNAFICIRLDENGSKEDIDLPYFKFNTMYTGMEVSVNYTLKQLGL